MSAARGDYTRVPVDEDVELKNAQQRAGSPGLGRSPAVKQGEEAPPSRAMVVFSVTFYLVAAIVVRSHPPHSTCAARHASACMRSLLRGLAARETEESEGNVPRARMVGCPACPERDRLTPSPHSVSTDDHGQQGARDSLSCE